MKKQSFCLAAAALLLAGSVTVGSAIAYFTTYATASGGAEVELGFTTTEPNEEIKEGSKHIKVENTGANDCFVRVRILYGDRYEPGRRGNARRAFGGAPCKRDGIHRRL